MSTCDCDGHKLGMPDMCDRDPKNWDVEYCEHHVPDYATCRRCVERGIDERHRLAEQGAGSAAYLNPEGTDIECVHEWMRRQDPFVDAKPCACRSREAR